MHKGEVSRVAAQFCGDLGNQPRVVAIDGESIDLGSTIVTPDPILSAMSVPRPLVEPELGFSAEESRRATVVVHYVEHAGHVVPSGLVDGAAVVEIFGVAVAPMLGVHSSAGKHRRVIGRGARLLADGTGVQCEGALAHEPVKRRGSGLAKFFDGPRVETIDRDGDHVVDRIVGRLIIGSVRQDRRFRC